MSNKFVLGSIEAKQYNLITSLYRKTVFNVKNLAVFSTLIISGVT